MQSAKGESRRTRITLVLSLAALAVALFGECFGPSLDPRRLPRSGRVFSPNGRFELRSDLSYRTYRTEGDEGRRYSIWQYQVFDVTAGEEVWQHREHQDGWYDFDIATRFAYGAAFVSDDGQFLITISPRIGPRLPSRAVRVYRRDEVLSIPFATICQFPRRLYPGESRPCPLGHGLRIWDGAKWWSDATYDGQVLSIKTTGISSCQIDVPALVKRVSQGETVEQALAQASRRSLNIATLIRWLVYAVIVVPATVVVLRSAVRIPGWLLARHRRTRASESRCPHCGYPVYGLPEPRCPECGKTFDADLLVAAEPPRPTTRQLRGAFAIALACGLAVHVGVHELRELLYKYVPTIGGVGLISSGKKAVDAFYVPWWCTEFVLAWPPIIIAIMMYRLLRTRRG